jgi:Kef-type K+ transport system membrane component KefB
MSLFFGYLCLVFVMVLITVGSVAPIYNAEYQVLAWSAMAMTPPSPPYTALIAKYHNENFTLVSRNP